jgi:hypothetical protein
LLDDPADRKASARLKAEHERSDKLLASERQHSTAQLEEERRQSRQAYGPGPDAKPSTDGIRSA